MKRVFRYGDKGGEFVQIERDGDDERLEWAAVRRFVKRHGTAFVNGELETGEVRNAGVIDWPMISPWKVDDFWDWLDEWAEAMYRRPGQDDDEDDVPAVVAATVMI